MPSIAAKALFESGLHGSTRDSQLKPLNLRGSLESRRTNYWFTTSTPVHRFAPFKPSFGDAPFLCTRGKPALGLNPRDQARG
jgi:hypothetical protein